MACTGIILSLPYPKRIKQSLLTVAGQTKSGRLWFVLLSVDTASLWEVTVHASVCGYCVPLFVDPF